MSAPNDFKQIIKAYLDERAEADELFAKAYAKENKSLDECCSYIMGEAKKRGTAVAMKDDEVFGLAVHYYDEDNLKVSKLPANTRVTTGTSSVKLTKEDKEKARKAALKRLEEEQYALLRKKPAKKKVNDEDVQQMTLF